MRLVIISCKYVIMKNTRIQIPAVVSGHKLAMQHTAIFTNYGCLLPLIPTSVDQGCLSGF